MFTVHKAACMLKNKTTKQTTKIVTFVSETSWCLDFCWKMYSLVAAMVAVIVNPQSILIMKLVDSKMQVKVLSSITFGKIRETAIN